MTTTGVNYSYARHRPTSSSDDTYPYGSPRREIISPVAERPQKSSVLNIANLLCDAPPTRALNKHSNNVYDSDDDDTESRTLRSGRDSLFDDATTMTSITSPPSSVCDDNEKQREAMDEDKSNFKTTSSTEFISSNWSTEGSTRKVPYFERTLPRLNPDDKLPTMEVLPYRHSDHPLDSNSRHTNEISLPRMLPPLSPASNSLSEPKYSSNIRRSSYGPSSPPTSHHIQRAPYSGSYAADSSSSRGSSPSREFGYQHSRQSEPRFPNGFRPPNGINVSESRDTYQVPPRKFSTDQGYRSGYTQKPEPHIIPRHHTQYTGTSSRTFNETFLSSSTRSADHPPPRFPRHMDTDTAHHSSQNNYGYSRSSQPQVYPPSPRSHYDYHRPSPSSSSSSYDQQHQSAFTRLPRSSSSQPVTPTSPGIYPSNSTDYFQRRVSAHHYDMPVSGTTDQDLVLHKQQQQQPQFTTMLKAKRKRANASQLDVLNKVFEQTFFPSTELRIQLGKQLGMSPRTVQIWFQNKRQSWRQKSKPDSDLFKEENENDDGTDVSITDAGLDERKFIRKSSVLSLSSEGGGDDDASMDEISSDATKSPKSFSSYVPCLTPLSLNSTDDKPGKHSPTSSSSSSMSPKLISTERAHPYHPKTTVIPHKQDTSSAQIPTPRTTPLLSS